MTASTTTQSQLVTNINQLDFNKLYTYEEYCTWQFSERVELIDGMLYKLMSAPRIVHQLLSGSLFFNWYGFFQNKNCKVFAAPVDVFFENLQNGKINTIVQPDICIVCDTCKIEEKGIRGAPDLIIEILSPSNFKRELTDKFNLYQREGVKEYWLAHPVEKWIIIYSLNKEGKYLGSKHFTPEDGFINSILFADFKLDLKALFNFENTTEATSSTT